MGNVPDSVERVSAGFEPRPFQAELFTKLKRFNVLCLHRRFGKTVMCIMYIMHMCLSFATNKGKYKNPHYAYVAPTYGQAKRVAWEYFKDFFKVIPNAEFKEGELKVVFTLPIIGTVSIWLIGAENPDSMRGMYLDGVILDEYADMNPIIWTQVIMPALADRDGWAVFIGTPKGQNHFYKLNETMQNMKGWYCRTIGVSESKVIDDETLAMLKASMSEDEYAQEMECDWNASLQGMYYSSYINDAIKEKRIMSVPYDPAVPVDTFWDLGISDTTAIWFVQRVGREIHLIDFEVHAGRGLEFYAKLLQNKPYVYGRHTLPHDGAARELGTGKTRQETLLKFGLRTDILPRQAIADGIHACRSILPRCWFDLNKTEDGLNALKAYQRKWDPKNNMFLDKPLHNWASNGADAFRYLALGLRETYGTLDMADMPSSFDDYNEFDY